MFVIRAAGMSLMMSWMPVLYIRVNGNCGGRIGHRRAVLAKWHRHRAVALQRQPKRNENNNPIFPTTHIASKYKQSAWRFAKL